MSSTDNYYNPLPAKVRYTKIGLHASVALINLVSAFAIMLQLKLWPVAILNLVIVAVEVKRTIRAVRL